MDITYKFVLDKRRFKSDNIYSLKLRIFQNRRFKEYVTGIRLHETAWDDKQQIIIPSDIGYKKNSFILNSLKTRIEKIILLAEDGTEYLTPEILLNRLNKPQERKADVLLAGYGEALINSLKIANRAGTALAYQDAVNSLTCYGGKNLLIKDITYRFLEEYNSHMLSKGVKVNSIAAYLRSIRAIYNRAIKEGLAELQHYPFNQFKIETEDTFSRTLTIEEMQRIISTDLPSDTSIWHNRNYFLLSFYLIGINFTDLFHLTANDITDNMVRYRRDKTGKLYCIGIPEDAKSIFSYYRHYKSNNGHKYLLPAL
ncbi:MAG: site-specific integrase, partial [Taibaiella sp.]|nr:site-specific integrase [Taibaiella sp.]